MEYIASAVLLGMAVLFQWLVSHFVYMPRTAEVTKVATTKPLSRSTIEAYAGIIGGVGYSALTALKIPVNFWIGLILWIGVVFCLVDLAWNSAPMVGRRGLGFFATGLILIASVLVLSKGWANTHQKEPPAASQPESKNPLPVVVPIPDATLNEMKKALEEIRNNSEARTPQKASQPFAVEIDCAVFTHTPKDTANGFWIGYNGPQGLTRTPAHVTVHLRLTNLQSGPAMISKYSIKINDWKMTKISVPQVDVFFAGCATSSLACWLDDDHIIDKQLVGLNLKPRSPIQGWTLLQYPLDSVPTYLDESTVSQMKFSVSITDIEGISFTSRPIVVKSDPANDSTQIRELKFARGRVDLNRYKYRDYFYWPLI